MNWGNSLWAVDPLSEHPLEQILAMRARNSSTYSFLGEFKVASPLRCRKAAQRSKKGSEKVLGRLLEKGSEKGAFFYGL